MQVQTKVCRGVRRKKTPLYRAERVLLYAAAFTAGLFTVASALTIIGIILAVFTGAYAWGLFALARGLTDVKCAHCQRPESVKYDADMYNCPACKNNNVIEWETIKGRRACKRRRKEIERQAVAAQREAVT